MKKTFSKIAVVALALSIATTTSALTAADIQLLVSMGVIPADKAAAAMAALGGSSTTTTSCGTYTRDITLGSTGADVVALQTYLESKGHLVIPTGVSKGYFGALTQTALAKYQVAMGISPAAGYFGPMTRAKVSADCSTTGTGTSTGSDSDSNLGGGEASLESFDISSGDDSDVEEGSDGDVAEIEFDVEDGDIMLDRVDLQFAVVDATTTTDLWDVLDMVELVIDGDVVGEADLSDEDEYLDEDEGTVRISGIDTKIEEGETATIIVRVTAQDNVDSEDLGTFSVLVLEDGIRGTDGEGIQQYVPADADSDAIEFDVEEAGTDEELNVSSSNEDPDSTTFKVENDAKSDAHAIFAFDLEAEEGDIELNEVTVEVVTSATTSDMVSDFILEIDGEEFDDWSFVAGGTSTREVVFDIDGDYTIDADDEVVVVLWAEFKAANDTNYSSGATISASIDDLGVEGEGADDELSDGTATGETHILATEGIVVDKSGFSDEGSSSNNDAGTSRDYTFSFEVTAFEEDFYIASTTVVVDFAGPTGATASTTYSVQSTGDEDTAGVFTVNEGETETFTVTVTVSNVSADGQYSVYLESVDYSQDTDGVTGAETKTVTQQDFDTAPRTVNAN